MSLRPRRLAAALLGLGLLASVSPSSAQTASVSRSTSITGSFKVGSERFTLRAETRFRSLATGSATAPTKPTLVPNEAITTIMLCKAAGCGLPVNRLCIARTPQVNETNDGGTIRIASSDPECTVEVVASVDEPRMPDVFFDRVESVAGAEFEPGSKIFGSAATGTDGRVVRTVTWYTDVLTNGS